MRKHFAVSFRSLVKDAGCARLYGIRLWNSSDLAGRLLYRQIAGLLAAQDAIDMEGACPISLAKSEPLEITDAMRQASALAAGIPAKLSRSGNYAPVAQSARLRQALEVIALSRWHAPCNVAFRSRPGLGPPNLNLETTSWVSSMRSILR
jgi:hypothetical protein